MRIHVIGDTLTVNGFKLIGIEGTIINQLEENENNDFPTKIVKVIEDLSKKRDVGLIIISDNIYEDESIHEYLLNIRMHQKSPIILNIPSSKTPKTKESLMQIVSRFLGGAIHF